jgi:uncharacterized membrane-anchored protein
MISLLRGATAALLMCAGVAEAKPFSEMFPDAKARFTPEAVAALASLDYKQGEIPVGDIATLSVGEGFYYLDRKDANYVLTELWGNPPSEGTLGMLFPARYTPLDFENWGIEVNFDDIGYVSDEDAAGYDYDVLLEQMQADTRAENGWRRENGYPAIELIGWAAAPRYDQAERKLYWAKELAFEGDPSHTLNYNIRALGRRGVLNLNFIAGIEALAEVQAAVPDVLGMVSFSEGNRYSDFDPSVDTVAAVGIGGLIAGKVLAKTGLLAVALVALKKFWIIALLPLIWMKKLFTRRGTS